MKAGTSPQKSIGAHREQVPFSMAIEMGNSCTSVFPNTRVGPPTTSRVTSAGVTRITLGNSGKGNSVLAVNRVANALD